LNGLARPTEREQTFFGQSLEIRFPRLMPPCKAVMPLCLLVLAIASICPAQAQEEPMTGKSATGNITWEIRPPADNRSDSTIWLWPDGQKDKATQLGGSQDAEPQTIDFSVDDAWIVVQRHLSSGSVFSFYRKQADGSYTEDESAEDFFDNGGIDKMATSEQVDRSSVGFEKWTDGFGPYAFAFSWNARLSRRGPDTFLLLCRGWRGVYDLQKHAVVKTLEPSKILTASDVEEDDLNEDYRQLRSLLVELLTTREPEAMLAQSQGLFARADKLGAYRIEPEHSTIWRDVGNEIAIIPNKLERFRVEHHQAM